VNNEMRENDSFSILDEAAIKSAALCYNPYDFAFVDQAIEQRHRMAVLEDLPEIPHRGSYSLSSLRYGEKFAACVRDLLSVRFRKLVEQKFDMGLAAFPPCIVMMGNTTGHYNEGYAHSDSRHKIVTVLVGFSASWPHERGRLRVLRSNNRDDYAFEFAPELGKMLMFRVCDHSWHGFLPQKGRRMSLQLCYVDSRWYAYREDIRHRMSAFAKSIPGVRQVIDWAPRSLGNKG
jgi:hypothetical protein